MYTNTGLGAYLLYFLPEVASRLNVVDLDFLLGEGFSLPPFWMFSSWFLVLLKAMWPTALFHASSHLSLSSFTPFCLSAPGSFNLLGLPWNLRDFLLQDLFPHWFVDSQLSQKESWNRQGLLAWQWLLYKSMSPTSTLQICLMGLT